MADGVRNVYVCARLAEGKWSNRHDRDCWEEMLGGQEIRCAWRRCGEGVLFLCRGHRQKLARASLLRIDFCLDENVCSPWIMERQKREKNRGLSCG